MTQASIFDQAVKMEKLLCGAFVAQQYIPFYENGVAYVCVRTPEEIGDFGGLLNISQKAEDVVRAQP